ncbi:nuclear transport factor 2 family protein [Actinoplanes auranticolor]|uniref:SnoaL-like domain-containing protein n=1 Tax=Actinoplanes auranticolor TaxID=47988 RepID=A0A919VQW5_9ACTN|nr:nuclear transport factor 2 family protein [Actinoplanes auranticolor]GIM66022.1 hypothetical protein Aau02nite_21300 [Actinoplanes auranticolor]
METDDLHGHWGRRALLGGSAAATLGLLGLSAGPAHAGSGGRESRNKRRVAEAFRAAAEHGTLNQANDFYLDILHEDAIWTVASVPPRTYPNRAQFLARGSAPILSRLSTPIYPQVRALYAEGDTVVAVWDGTATALDGRPYLNTYNWVFTMRGRRAVRVQAFLDLVVVNDLIERIPDPPD